MPSTWRLRAVRLLWTSLRTAVQFVFVLGEFSYWSPSPRRWLTFAVPLPRGTASPGGIRLDFSVTLSSDTAWRHSHANCRADLISTKFTSVHILFDRTWLPKFRGPARSEKNRVLPLDIFSCITVRRCTHCNPRPLFLTKHLLISMLAGCSSPPLFNYQLNSYQNRSDSSSSSSLSSFISHTDSQVYEVT